MNDHLSDLLHTVADRVWPTILPAEEVRRIAERRRHSRRVTALLTAAVAAIAVVSTGAPPVRQMWHSGPRDVVTINPGSGQPPLTISDDRFMDAPDVGLVRTDAAPAPLSPCLGSPLDWDAEQSGGVRYVPPGKTTPVFNEFVLRYDSVAEAHRAVAIAWREFGRCPTTPEVATDPLTPPEPFAQYQLDEWFANQRATFASARMSGLPVHMYALRVARRDNIVVVIEDIGASDDRAYELLDKALSVAARPSPR